MEVEIPEIVIQAQTIELTTNTLIALGTVAYFIVGIFFARYGYRSVWKDGVDQAFGSAALLFLWPIATVYIVLEFLVTANNKPATEGPSQADVVAEKLRSIERQVGLLATSQDALSKRISAAIRKLDQQGKDFGDDDDWDDDEDSSSSISSTSSSPPS